MRTYEALYIISPQLGEDDIQTISQEVETLVTKDDGTIVRSEIWGKRRLAYEVKKHSDGYYVLLRFTAMPETIGKLEGHFKLSESIIRYLIQYFDKHRLRVEEEQLKQNEEELQASAGGGRGRGAAGP